MSKRWSKGAWCRYPIHKDRLGRAAGQSSGPPWCVQCMPKTLTKQFGTSGRAKILAGMSRFRPADARMHPFFTAPAREIMLAVVGVLASIVVHGTMAFVASGIPITILVGLGGVMMITTLGVNMVGSVLPEEPTT